MADPRTLRDRTLLASLGLDEQDVKAINQKINMAKRLKEKFIEIDDDTNIVSADILFVNAEKKSTMEYYDKCHPHLSAVPVFVYTNKALEEAEAEAEAAMAAAEAAAEEEKEEEKAVAEAAKAKAKAKALSLKKYSNAIAIKKPVTLSRLTDVLFNIVSSNESAPTKAVEVSEQSDLTEGSAAESSDSAVQQDLPIATETFRVLVVDDSFPVRKYLEKKLPTLLDEIDNSLKIDIQFANSGKESVDKVTEARGDFDMVFLDVMMEDVNGYQVCKWIKKVKNSINVVMLTSKSSTIDRVRAKLCGCNNFISKPPKDKHLKKVILAHEKFK